MNYIAALMLTRKSVSLQFLSDAGVKMRPSKAKVPERNFFPITHSIVHYNTISQKDFFATQKSLRVLKLSNLLSERVLSSVLSDSVLFRFLSDWVFFRFLTDKVLFKVFSDIVVFEFSVIDSSKGP